MTGKSNWTDTQDIAFDVLKHKSTNAPALVIPNPDKLFLLSTDAGQIAMGATLEQRQADGC